MPRNTRPTMAYPVTLRELEVCRVADVTPGMRRVTLTGTQLETFTNADGHVEPAEWCDERVFVWLAGEQATVRSLRRYLIRDRGIAKTDIDFTGYWKRGEAVRADS